ncbi:hypothetical protein GCM10011609_35470 [Lentzea pudingi]|uniref:Luciferase-like domain-containing protein n=1 Tax=Lentzea pudingi TaxID=1789439 RepID=A0ABQ2HXY7_9PSEU|nr:LLM class flavin-dependent oxidoreductase [Lentzea pudingi]GGM94891.1 hypothetical protein GCM10011609_35470 [Lentzea pudingi]
MRVSVFMGPFSRGPQEDKPNIDLCIEQAVQAAEAGFAMVTFGEQHFNNYEPYSNPFLMAARLAPHLGETWFGTTIVPLVFHDPLRLAEDASVVDLLLAGRFILGMSAGRVGFSPDFANFGLYAEDRDAIFASKLDTLRAAFAHEPGDPPIEVDTPWHRGTLNGRLMPVSHRAGGPLLAIGTNTDATIVRIAEQGTPVFLGPCTLPDAAAKFRTHRDAAIAAGHSESDVDVMSSRSLVTRHVIVGRTSELAWERAELMAGANPMMDRSNDGRSLRELAKVDLAENPDDRNAKHVQSWILAGDPDEVTAQMLAYRAAGVPQLLTRFTVGGYNPDEIRDSFRRFVDHVMPALDAPVFPPLPEHEVRKHESPVLPAVTGLAGTGEIEGKWRVVLDTPMGRQPVELELLVDEGSLRGTVTQGGAAVDLADGQVNGQDATFTAAVTQPFPITITYAVTVAGDTISGTAQAGAFPPSPLTGERA